MEKFIEQLEKKHVDDCIRQNIFEAISSVDPTFEEKVQQDNLPKNETEAVPLMLRFVDKTCNDKIPISIPLVLCCITEAKAETKENRNKAKQLFDEIVKSAKMNGVKEEQFYSFEVSE